MKKPYIICHMLQSIDGRISGQFFRDSRTQQLAKIYREMSTQFEADAILYGSVTIEELYTDGKIIDLDAINENTAIQGDYIVDTDSKKWIVVIDPKGTLGWDQSVLRKSRLRNKNIVVILLETVSKNYLMYLQKLGISYILGGKDTIDLPSVVATLHDKCKIEKLLLQGGGIVNGSFINADLVEELSLVIAPTLSVEDVATCFEASSYVIGPATLVKYQLKELDTLPASGVWLNYQRNT